MADVDLLELLSADHRILLEEPAPNVSELSQHLSVERDLLYPAIRHHLPDGETVVADLRRSERHIETLLEAYERRRGGESDDLPGELRQAVCEHVTSQERLFARFRQEIPEADLVRAVATVPLSIGGSPTHAHVRLAAGGPAGEMAEDAASAADHWHDRVARDRRDPGR